MPSVLPAFELLSNNAWPSQIDQTTLSSQQTVGDIVGANLVSGTSSVRVNPNPSARPVLVGSVLPGMLSDYYGRIYIIPDTFNLVNPVRNLPFEYQVWNAFQQSNTLQRFDAGGTTGLTNTLAATQAFGPLKMLSFDVTITDGAPFQLSARYDYDFAFGRAVLQVIATLATVVELVPEAPLTQRLAWRTDILRTHNGTEQRISTRARPRQTLIANLLATSHEEVRRLLTQIYTEIAGQVFIPLWYEPFELTAEAAAGATLIQVDLTFGEIEVDDTIYVVSPDESVTVAAIVSSLTTSSITVSAPLAQTLPIGSSLYRTLAANIEDGTAIERPPVNAGAVQLVATATSLRSLKGTGGATPAAFNARLLLDRQPLNNAAVRDAVDIGYDMVDFGVRRSIFTNQPRPNVGGVRTYTIQSRAEWQYWKRVLDDIQGARGAFYAPTFRPDLQLVTQPAQAGSSLQVTGETSYTSAWFAANAYRSLMIRDGAGNSQPKLVTNSVANGDGTHTLTISPALTDTPLGSTVQQIEFLPICRLASDVVEVRHFGYRSELTLSIQSETTT